MPQTTVETSTAKHLAVFVTFTWGDSPVKTAKYVRFDTAVDDYASCKELAVVAEKQHGGVQDAPHSLQIARTRLPVSELIRPYAHSPVLVEIAKADPYDRSGTWRVTFSGMVVKTTRNLFRLQRLVRVDVAGWKAFLSSPLGGQCLGSCDHVLGDYGCLVDLGLAGSNRTQTGTCTAISGYTITVTGLTSPSPKWFRFGEARYDGLRLWIAEQISSTQFRLGRLPPPEWIGSTITMVVGCDKDLDGDCRNKFANESRYRALGKLMPAYNPQYENP